MKIIIREDKRDRLAKQILTDEFSGLYKDKNYTRDSVGTQLSIRYGNVDYGTIMIYGDRSEVLYICEDVTKPIIYFSYTPQQLKNIVGEWFSETFGLPVKIVQHVDKDRLD